MRLKDLAFYIENYMRLPFLFLHELSHWVVAVITCICFQNDFPIMKITRKFRVEEIDPLQSTTYGTSACVSYATAGPRPILVAMIASSPIFLTLALFIFSPWWIYPLYLSNFSSLWISYGDYEQIKEAFKKNNNYER